MGAEIRTKGVAAGAGGRQAGGGLLLAILGSPGRAVDVAWAEDAETNLWVGCGESRVAQRVFLLVPGIPTKWGVGGAAPGSGVQTPPPAGTERDGGLGAREAHAILGSEGEILAAPPGARFRATPADAGARSRGGKRHREVRAGRPDSSDRPQAEFALPAPRSRAQPGGEGSVLSAWARPPPSHAAREEALGTGTRSRVCFGLSWGRATAQRVGEDSAGSGTAPRRRLWATRILGVSPSAAPAVQGRPLPPPPQSPPRSQDGAVFACDGFGPPNPCLSC